MAKAIEQLLDAARRVNYVGTQLVDQVKNDGLYQRQVEPLDRALHLLEEAVVAVEVERKQAADQAQAVHGRPLLASEMRGALGYEPPVQEEDMSEALLCQEEE